MRSGCEEVPDRGALGQELGIRHVLHPRDAPRRQLGQDLRARSHRHRALHHEHELARGGRELLEHAPHRGQVGVAGVGRRGPDADEQDAGSIEDLCGLECEREPLAIAREELGQARLVDRHPSGPEPVDPVGHDVAHDHVVAELGEARRGHEADPAGAEYAQRRRRHCTAERGFRPFAIAIIVSFESSSSRVFVTQYTAPFSSNATMCSFEPS